MDEMTFALHNPLTEEEWDTIEDVDFDNTNSITFHTKHGKEVEFVKRKTGRWLPDNRPGGGFWVCSCCKFPSEAFAANKLYKYCLVCGTRMEGVV